jgi:hypothetical protein
MDPQYLEYSVILNRDHWGTAGNITIPTFKTYYKKVPQPKQHFTDIKN